MAINRVRRNFSLSKRSDERIKQRANDDNETKSRTLERIISEADDRQDVLRSQLRGELREIVRQCDQITRCTKQPGAVAGVAAIERAVAGISLRLSPQ